MDNSKGICWRCKQQKTCYMCKRAPSAIVVECGRYVSDFDISLAREFLGEQDERRNDDSGKFRALYS